ncbi:B12-binding domain-containing radical SAM protein [Malonomonas rubra]|uniref:B12-binding domain-containing radical SAM protein n=1 Tax=Malonomonas rubra TaxID=57040 RepID=UPI0026F1E595|nr:B12-binding domain-containing radical SAM protein [Malonomonas rubra]
MNILLTTLHSKYIHASLALPYLAAFCGPECGDIRICEYTVHEPKETVLSRIVEQQADVVAFSVYLWNRVATLELVACLKQVAPQLKIVLGGPEVSFEDADFFQYYPVDALVCGEGELPLRHLLRAWETGQVPVPIPGLHLPVEPAPSGRSLLDNLDELPSPFAAGLVDLSRGLVYYESSRGCPYTCSFCMSALDERVRSFSMERILSDLQQLIDAEVKQIKFVDRTFNYDNPRSREIFKFILQRNRCSHFHFEIGAHLLDEKTLRLLETVPPGMFQFEIGVQSSLPETLQQVGRRASLEKLAENVSRLRKADNIHLHLDLIAGLPGESYQQFLSSLEWVAQLHPHHLQVEPVKLLPGTPLRQQAGARGIRFDPNPPYAILGSSEIGYAELEKLRGISRLLDLLVNSHRFDFLLPLLVERLGGQAKVLADIESYWREKGLFQGSQPLREIYLQVYAYLRQRFAETELNLLREALARDYAHHERVVGGSEPEFFTSRITEAESAQVRQRVKQEIARLERTGKIQFFAAAFEHLLEFSGRTILIFLYLTKPGSGQRVREIMLEK